MSMQKIIISGGRIIDPDNDIDAKQSLCIADGRIIAIGNIPAGFQPDREIDASETIICPGFIDTCARLREPGEEYKASIASETLAAVRAGITTLNCPPDTNPVIDTPAVVELIRDKTARVGMARVLPIGALTQGLKGVSLSEMSALKRVGCTAVSNAHHPVASMLILRRAMEYAASYDLLMIIRPEDRSLSNQGCVHEGNVSTRLGLPGIPEAAETVAVAQVLALVAQTGVKVHFSQLSCSSSVRLIELALKENLAITADVSAHQLHLTEQDILNFNAECHVIPPLRSERDLKGLRRGLAKGVISAICSDHQPHEQGAKLEVFQSTKPGISSLETLLPLTLDLVEQNVMPLTRAITVLTSGPASALGIDRGNLSVGAEADICIFDPDKKWIIGEDQWVSRGLNTPFWGRTMKGRVTYTLIGGKVLYDANQTQHPATHRINFKYPKGSGKIE